MSARGLLELTAQDCTSCMLCVRECPSWSITLDSHTHELDEPGARRPRTVNVLDAFRVDYGTCMYCGICVEVCPFDALAWRDVVDAGTSQRSALVIDEAAR
mgnify:CR=1 FL=1